MTRPIQTVTAIRANVTPVLAISMLDWRIMIGLLRIRSAQPSSLLRARITSTKHAFGQAFLGLMDSTALFVDDSEGPADFHRYTHWLEIGNVNGNPVSIT